MNRSIRSQWIGLLGEKFTYIISKLKVVAYLWPIWWTINLQPDPQEAMMCLGYNLNFPSQKRNVSLKQMLTFQFVSPLGKMSYSSVKIQVNLLHFSFKCRIAITKAQLMLIYALGELLSKILRQTCPNLYITQSW